jgi:hypothetical protein
MTLELLTAFFGWALVVNLAIYTITAFALMAFKRLVATMSARWFGIEAPAALNESYAFLARFKLLVIVFFLGPWIALRLLQV